MKSTREGRYLLYFKLEASKQERRGHTATWCMCAPMRNNKLKCAQTFLSENSGFYLIFSGWVKFEMKIDLWSGVLALWQNWRATHLAVKTAAHFNQLKTRSRAAAAPAGNVRGQTTKETTTKMSNKQNNRQTMKTFWGKTTELLLKVKSVSTVSYCKPTPSRPSSKFLQTFYCGLHARKQGPTLRRAHPISGIWFFFLSWGNIWNISGQDKAEPSENIQARVCVFSNVFITCVYCVCKV